MQIYFKLNQTKLLRVPLLIGHATLSRKIHKKLCFSPLKSQLDSKNPIPPLYLFAV